MKKYSKNKSHRSVVLVVVFFVFSFMNAHSSDMVRILNLEGSWQFTIGDDGEWASKEFNDENWDRIMVPSRWEDQGFHGYDGFAWYRKEFSIPEIHRDKSLMLSLGYIDDVDEVYFNGRIIGSSGSMPPNYRTAYNARREYAIPTHYVNYEGNNVIAVRVYDSYQFGGIVSGDIGIYADRVPLPLAISLQNKWKFNTGDNPEWKRPDFNDTGWDEIIVPAKWEDQGYRDYDGYAWYRYSFQMKNTLPGKKAVILLGKIDDLDQVYINGVFVGSTGNFGEEGYSSRRLNTAQEWSASRGYYFPVNLLKPNQVNTIAVRVYDSRGNGGIYEGPVGIITMEQYIKYWRTKKNYSR